MEEICMKKIIALILTMVLFFSLTACNTDDNTETTIFPSKTKVEYFDEAVLGLGDAAVGYLRSNSLNSNKLGASDSIHIPIFKFDTLEDLKSFKSESGGISDYFNKITKDYDNEFFNKNSLILVYIGSSSGTDTYGVDSVYTVGDKFRIHIERTNNPSVGTDDSVSRFIIVAVSDKAIKNCTNFDAIFEKTIKVKSIVDNSEGEKLFDAPERFYSDAIYNYYFPDVRGKFIIVTYADGTTENVREAFDKGHINLNDLDEFGIEYTKEEKTTTE